MAKLLQTNLPFATGPNVSADTFNQLVRTLEINLGSIDPDNTLQLTTAERDELNFNIGQIIYNTTTTTLQYWDGTAFQNISAIGAVNLNVSDGSSTIGININTQTLSLIGGTGITSNASGTSVTFAIDNTVATLTGTQTLTNKTLTSPTLTSPVLNGTLSGSAFLDEDNMASNSATAVASQQSIKAYVDSQVGTVDTLAEILANGNTTGGTDISVSTGDSITFDDGSLISNGTAFRIDGAPGKEVEIFSARDIRFVIDDNNDDTNNTFQVFRHNTGSSNMVFEIEQDGDTNLKLGDLQIAGTTVIDSSRNLTNIGTISSGAITSSGDIASDIFKGATYGSNSFLDFDDDNGVGGTVNTTTLAAIGNMNFILDTNNNEPNLFYWLHGNTAPSSATQLMSLDESGNLITTGDLKLGANGIIDTSSGHLIFKGSGVTAGQFTSTGFSVVGNVAISGNFNTSLGGYQVGGQTVITSGRNVQNVVDLTTTGQVEFLSGTGAAQATDKLYIGGSGLNSADAAIYIGNNGGGGGVGWRFYYEGSGTGNNNKLIIRSENQNNPKDALTFTQDGNATFVGSINCTEIGVTNIVTNKVVKYNGTVLDDSNITDTGSLITLGSNTTVSGTLTSSGLVTADELSVTNDATFNGSVDATGQDVVAATYNINNIAINGSSTTTTSATTQVAVDSVSKTTFRTVKYLVQITNSTDNEYHATEILVTHDGTTPSMTEYATIFTGTAEEATFSADISGSNLRLLATPASTDSMTFKITRTGIKV